MLYRTDSEDELQEIGRKLGGMLPIRMAAAVARVNRNTIMHWLEIGRVDGCVFLGWRLVGFNDLARVIAERRGRGLGKVDTGRKVGVGA